MPAMSPTTIAAKATRDAAWNVGLDVSEAVTVDTTVESPGVPAGVEMTVDV